MSGLRNAVVQTANYAGECFSPLALTLSSLLGVWSRIVLPLRMPNPRCFFDIEIEGESLGRLEFELFVARCPRTVENFRRLCVGVPGEAGRVLGYKGHAFHRVINWFILQVSPPHGRSSLLRTPHNHSSMFHFHG